MLQDIRDARARAHNEVVALLRKPQTTETRAQAARIFADIDRMGADLHAQEASACGTGRAHSFGREYPWADPKEQTRAEIFERQLRDQVSDTDRKWLRENRAVAEGDLLAQIGSYSGLGFFVPAGFIYDVENALKYFAPLIDGSVVSVMETATGQPLPYPVSNDTDQEAQIVGESAAIEAVDTGRGGSPLPDQDVRAGHINFGDWKYTTGQVKASVELIQDTAFNLSSWLADRFAIRFGRAYERDMTVGDGNGRPTGLLTEIANNNCPVVTANGSSETSGGPENGGNSVGYSDLVRLEHSIDPSYRRGGKYMLHDTTLSHLKRILDKFGRPLWTAGIKEGAPDTINGYAYVVNQHMPQVAASEQPIVFGDLRKYVIRKVSGMAVQVLRERYADFGQVAFLALSRVDGRLVDAGTHPVAVLQNAS
jgi:HK97 family phage major capsid protein